MSISNLHVHIISNVLANAVLWWLTGSHVQRLPSIDQQLRELCCEKFLEPTQFSEATVELDIMMLSFFDIFVSH